jgi:hypothetical protein
MCKLLKNGYLIRSEFSRDQIRTARCREQPLSAEASNIRCLVQRSQADVEIKAPHRDD